MNLSKKEIATIHTCFSCPFMGLASGGQVAICMKSNIGYINKKTVNLDSIPEWCPIKSEV
jgi:hypothetical protein